MRINQKQIMQLIAIAQAYIVNCQSINNLEAASLVDDLLIEIAAQQSEELKEIE